MDSTAHIYTGTLLALSQSAGDEDTKDTMMTWNGADEAQQNRDSDGKSRATASLPD